MGHIEGLAFYFLLLAIAFISCYLLLLVTFKCESRLKDYFIPV